MIWSYSQPRKPREPEHRSLFPLLCLALLIFLTFAFFHSSSGRQSLRKSRKHLKPDILPTTLVLIPGHGIYLDSQWRVANWLKPYIPAIEEQLTYTFNKFGFDGTSLIVFSGGQTHEGSPVSEAESYMLASRDLNLRGDASRVALEEYARDSLENLLFSVCRFKQVVGSYPEKIIVVGFEFKRQRFEEEHRNAIRFTNFEYVGIGEGGEQAEMERQGTIAQFKSDPYGCAPPLSTKRRERNPFKREHEYHCAEMEGLFNACGKLVFDGPLPWT